MRASFPKEKPTTQTLFNDERKKNEEFSTNQIAMVGVAVILRDVEEDEHEITILCGID